MAAIIVNTTQLKRGTSEKGLERNSRKKYRYYAVTLSEIDPQNGADIALGSPDLPNEGDSFDDGSGDDSRFLCTNIRADYAGENSFTALVTVTYEINSLTESILNGELEPWNRAPLYDLDEITYQRPLVRDFNTDPNFSGGIPIQTDPDVTFDPSSTAYNQTIQNSAKQMFADPIVHPVSNLLVRIRQAFKVEDWDYQTISLLQGTLNDDVVTINGNNYKVGQCKLNNVKAPETVWISPIDGTSTRYYDTTLEIEIASGASQENDAEPVGHDFSLKVHNVGYHFRDSNRQLQRCTVNVNIGGTTTTVPSATPLPLDPETGGLWTKKNDDGSLADIPLLTFFPFPYADWTPLGLNQQDGFDDTGE